MKESAYRLTKFTSTLMCSLDQSNRTIIIAEAGTLGGVQNVTSDGSHSGQSGGQETSNLTKSAILATVSVVAAACFLIVLGRYVFYKARRNSTSMPDLGAPLLSEVVLNFCPDDVDREPRWRVLQPVCARYLHKASSLKRGRYQQMQHTSLFDRWKIQNEQTAVGKGDVVEVVVIVTMPTPSMKVHAEEQPASEGCWPDVCLGVQPTRILK
ncbi:uncharacterized protein LAESUDRAFT_92126 [Laetiporus sulphureus 93-53]|uniref:Uncharacterized protein n=1 Tax=Laetiporus sulphureus 93-53 TaxID=1314785 RepID=A0A165EZ57_9APHY|nr:uncharacterized protein LAESUDRAFT_92126 [Laetiporus sulphureus 93-53]KZT08024.1 hypothetical protein LAESUDRAFT_92126 [Laetiporus sulphureus 93-53]